MPNNKIPNPAFDHAADFVVRKVEERTKEASKEPSIEKGKYVFAELAIGKHIRRYLAIFKKISKGNFFIPSKWALIFGLNWLIYRRAAYHGFILYSLMVLISYEFVTSLSFLPKLIQASLIIGLPHVALFFTGNFIYWYSVRSKIDKYRKLYGDTSAITYLSEKGGVIGGFSLIASVIMLQGIILSAVIGTLYVDDFVLKIWDDFLQLAYINK